MRTRTVTGVAALLLAATGWAVPAHAEIYGIDDPADAGGSPNDLYSLSVRHSTDNVVVKLTFADLRRDSSAGMSVFVDTDAASQGPDFALGTGLGDGTDYALTRTDGWRSTGAPLDCSYELRLRWARDVAKLRMARDCFDDPARVRVSVKMVDAFDASHPIRDWAPARKRFSLWLRSGWPASTT